MEKSPVFIGAVAKAPDGSMGISMAPLATKDHARQRGAMAYCFTNQALLQQQSLMKLHIDKLIAQLKQMTRRGEPVDMSSWCECEAPSPFDSASPGVADAYEIQICRHIHDI